MSVTPDRAEDININQVSLDSPSIAGTDQLISFPVEAGIYELTKLICISSQTQEAILRFR